jgi:hypothetical protein
MFALTAEAVQWCGYMVEPRSRASQWARLKEAAAKPSGPAWLGAIASVLGVIVAVIALRVSSNGDNPDPAPSAPSKSDTVAVPVIDSVGVTPQEDGTLLNVSGKGGDVVTGDLDLFVVAAFPPAEEGSKWQTSPAAEVEPSGAWHASLTVRPGDVQYVLHAVVASASSSCRPGFSCSPAPTVLPLGPNTSGVVFTSPPRIVDA